MRPFLILEQKYGSSYIHECIIDQNLQTILLITLNISLIVSNIINVELYVHGYTESIYFNDMTARHTIIRSHNCDIC